MASSNEMSQRWEAGDTVLDCRLAGGVPYATVQLHVNAGCVSIVGAKQKPTNNLEICLYRETWQQ